MSEDSWLEMAPKRAFFRLAIFVFAVAMLLSADWLFGLATGTVQIRRDALQFGTEIGQLRIPTRHLVPNIDHTYFEPYRPEGDRFFPRDTPRRLRTDHWGSIVGGDGGYRRTPSIRVVFLGGSTTESNEVDESLRFPTAVGRGLREEQGLDVDAYNLGVRGHTTQDSLTALLQHPLVHNSTHVVLMHNINDRLFLASRGHYFAELSSAGANTAGRVHEAAYGLGMTLWDYISHRSNFLFRVRRVHDSWRARERITVDERAIDFADSDFEASKAMFAANLRAFVDVSRAFGHIPILLTQPLGRRSRAQDEFNDVIRWIADERNSHIVDLDALLPEPRGQLFFSDKVHLNNEGSVAVTNILVKRMPALLAQRGSKPVERLSTSTLLDNLTRRCLPPPSPGQSFATGPRRQVIARPARYPSLSSDGRWLLFHTWEGGSESVIAYDVRRGKEELIAGAQWAKNNRHPTFLRAASEEYEVVFGSNKDGIERLYRVSRGERFPALLSPDHTLSASIPSSDGHSVVFAGTRHRAKQPRGGPDLFELNLDTGISVQLTRTPWEEWRPVISPDGRYVYFIANPRGNFDIFRMRREAGARAEIVFGSEADEWDPAISRDGRWLTFASRKGGTWDLYLIDSERPSRIVALTSGPEDDWDPSLTDDGRTLFFASSAGGDPHIYLLCVFGEMPTAPSGQRSEARPRCPNCG